MKNLKILVVLTFLAAALCMPMPSQAQLTTPQINGVGSSGVFTTMAIAMASPDTVLGYSSAVCGTRVWTFSSASKVYAIDPGSVSIPHEPGNIAVVWDNDTAPGVICSYFSVDSIVGDRLFLRQTGGGGVSGNGTIFLDSSVTTIGGQNKIAYLSDTATSGLPSAVWSILNGSHFNVAFTDIRPDDAEFAVNRATCTPADQLRCFGFSTAPIGSAVLSTWNTNSVANTTTFSVSGGSDPFSSLTVPATTTIAIGADPVMIIYNTSDTSSASSLGTLLPSNVLSHVVNMFWTGRSQGSQDLTGQIIPGVIVDVVQREPVSGTYNTFDFQGVEDRDADINLTMEVGFGPGTGNPNGMPGQPACGFSVPGTATYVSPPRNTFCANPMNVPGPGNGGLGYNRKYRAIGTGEMVSSIDSTNGANRIGYAFFGLGTFGGKHNTRYMKVDGVDPILPNYDTSGDMSSLCSGKVNLGTFACTHAPSFDGVAAGNYRYWNIIRAVRYSSYSPPTSGPSVDQLVLATQDQAHSATGPHDIFPYQYCTASSTVGTCTSTVQNITVFRVHYPLGGITVGASSNGNGSEPAENGGDMAGAILPKETDASFSNITGSDVTGYIQ